MKKHYYRKLMWEEDLVENVCENAFSYILLSKTSVHEHVL